jgi:hypothetical protein
MEYAILIAPPQQWLHERTSMLRNMSVSVTPHTLFHEVVMVSNLSAIPGPSATRGPREARNTTEVGRSEYVTCFGTRNTAMLRTCTRKVSCFDPSPKYPRFLAFSRLQASTITMNHF